MSRILKLCNKQQMEKEEMMKIKSAVTLLKRNKKLSLQQ